MIVRNSFTQTCLAFARPMWTRFRTDILRMVWGTLAAIIATTILMNLQIGDLGLPAEGIKFMRFLGNGTGLLIFAGCYSLASKLSGNFSGETDVRRMLLAFTLPVTTRDIVLAPMIAAIVSVSAFWIAFWFAAVLPYGGPAPFLLPLLLTGLMISASQAGNWTVFVRGSVGCLFLMMSIFAPILAALGLLNHFSVVAMNAIVVVLTAISIRIALVYAPISRHTIPTKFTTAAYEKHAHKVSKPSRARSAPKRATPLSTQVWFYKAHKLDRVTMFFVTIAAAIMLIRIPASTSELVRVGPVRMIPEIYEFGFMIPIAGFIAVMFTTVIGMTINGMPTKGQKVVTPLPTFSAIRPITSAQLFVSQAFIALRCALAATYIVWIAILLWTLSPVEVDGHTMCLFTYWVSIITPSGVALTILTASLLPVILFGFQMASMARSRLSTKVGKFVGFLPSILMFAAIEALMLCKLSGLAAFGHWAQNQLPAGILLLGIKFAIIPLVQFKLEQNHLLDRSTFYKCAGVWLASVLILTVVFYPLLPPGYITLPQLGVLFALILPANRMLWQIYSLDQTRHIGAIHS